MNRTVPELNVSLLEATMGAILAEPQNWDQARFARTNACGTTFCFAGHALNLNGYTHRFVDGFNEAGDLDWRDPVGRRVSATTAATQLLGITSIEADTLFSPNHLRDIDELHRCVKDLIESRQSGDPR